MRKSEWKLSKNRSRTNVHLIPRGTTTGHPPAFCEGSGVSWLAAGEWEGVFEAWLKQARNCVVCQVAEGNNSQSIRRTQRRLRHRSCSAPRVICVTVKD